MIKTVFIVTSDDALPRLIGAAIRGGHFETVIVRGINDLRHKTRTTAPDLVLLDTSASENGIDACKSIQSEAATAQTPIVAVISEARVDERAALLDAGVEDCIARTIAPAELAARLRLILRRTSTYAASSRLRAGPIEMDLDRWTVRVKGEAVNLTKKEFQLLETLLEAKGRTMTREVLLQHAWSYTASHAVDTRTVDVHIGRLRRKLGSAGDYIITVRNVGFRFDILTDWIAGYFG